jgi:subtilase family serine protease
LRKRFNILPILFFVMVVLSAVSQAAPAQELPQDRITQSIESSHMTALTGSEHPLAKPEFDTGLADNAKVLEGITINFQRSEAQEASLKALLQAQQDTGSASYHKWLTPAQFGALFGMSSGDIARVKAWLHREGFTITSVAQSNNAIGFSGSVASVERAFQTQIHTYSVNGETHFANATQVSIPGTLAGVVSSVRGLNDFRVQPRIAKQLKSAASGLQADFTSGISGTHLVAPGDFATIYDVSPLYSAGFTGKGVSLAVVGRTDIVPADITDFRAAGGLSANNPTVVTVPGTTPESVTAGAASGDLAETDLDLEWSGGVATGATVYLVNSNDVSVSLQYVVQNPINGITIPIISQSYGLCEGSYDNPAAQEVVLEQANTQGQTIILAAGDDGAADCDEGTATQPVQSAIKGLAVDYPGSSIYVTDVGGSEFTGDGTAASPQTGSGTYWNSNGTGGVNDDLITSAKSYIPEMPWNDTTFAISQGGGLDAGGGGASSLFTKPSWQTGVAGIPADGHRDVPDVSLNASNYHDAYLYCTQIETVGSPNTFVSSCQANSFRISDGSQSDNDGLTSAGGTSFAAPAFAGLLAIVEQKIGGSGGLGNINPSLYKLAANATTYASAFHDITTGNNEVPCTTGSPNCPTGSNPVIGYPAGTGYDQASGLGSVDANNLATAFANLVATTGTATALTVAPGASLVINESVTVTATVTPNTASSTAPTGTVTFFMDGTAQTPADLATASPYTATYKTSFASAGTHVITATYSGDSNYSASSSSSVTVTVAASGTAATTTTVAANPTTFPLGSSVTLTATVSGATAGTLTGPITFTTAGTTIGTVKQVTLGPGNTAIATLTVNAEAALGFAAGMDTITATYGGDSFNATSTGTTSVSVSNPGITLSAGNITISSPSPGHSGTSTITLKSTGGYAGTAVLSATASSLDADFAFAGSTAQTVNVALSSGGTGSSSITVTTIAAGGNLQNGIGGNLRKTAGRVAVAGGTAVGCILLLLIPGIRKKRWPAALVMLVFLSIGAGLGCGGGTGGASPAGAYTVTISATDSSNPKITGSTTFTVTVQ